MFETLKDFYQATSIIDLVYLLITILSLIKCYKKGFVLSILSMAKWLMAYVITLINLINFTIQYKVLEFDKITRNK